MISNKTVPEVVRPCLRTACSEAAMVTFPACAVAAAGAVARMRTGALRLATTPFSQKHVSLREVDVDDTAFYQGHNRCERMHCSALFRRETKTKVVLAIVMRESGSGGTVGRVMLNCRVCDYRVRLHSAVRRKQASICTLLFINGTHQE
eukprot:TRINITY_DN28159_c0_g1_i1.p1 TRINITY_DN28159_c0_g1~~TRINITY_DN28159_c0_g1_i1.p1  ORF type:complete len:149 (-),score=6.95 TRINITY_DN28159_c0_g1_i1:81-527(-)